tara:strand:- start:139 stop:495 length:357 start_codon:yes stop_codon:yes gene_type:complete
LLQLNPTSGVAIYRQIVDQVRRLVASRVLGAGETLPSVRALAAELSINPMTVSKAYSQLEQLGIVVRSPGVGMIVAETVQRSEDVIEPELDAVIASARQLGMELEELKEAVAQRWERT